MGVQDGSSQIVTESSLPTADQVPDPMGTAPFVVAATEDFHGVADSLAARHDLPVRPMEQLHGNEWILYVSDRVLQLRPPGQHDQPGGAVDWRPSRFRGNLSRRQPLARACGRCSHVWDATAGWGQDTFLLAQLGYQVTAAERATAIAVLLSEAAAASETLGGQINAVSGDSRELLPALALGARPDVVYIDPMFPPKRKRSALPKKEIQLLQQLVGHDTDSADLLAIAREVSQQRVVVKRPLSAPALAADPTVSYSGKLVRYDVYYV
ncbi:MAG: class I SAM-dependent methyltransferase [Planctomycetota bacterium]